MRKLTLDIVIAGLLMTSVDLGTVTYLAPTTGKILATIGLSIALVAAIFYWFRALPRT